MSQKFLDLAGLTVYDRKIKEWFKAGVVDITDDEIKALFVTPPLQVGPADNEIWYTTSNGTTVTPQFLSNFGAGFVENIYEDGKGILRFNGPVTYIPGTSNSRIAIEGGSGAFKDCSSLTSITLPNSVTCIGFEAFRGCSSLTSVTIGNSVTSIEADVFSGCSSLTSLVVSEGNPVYDNREQCNAIINTETNTLIRGCQNTIIPNSVTSIGYEAFEDCSSLTSIDIPDSVTLIYHGAFSNCSSLESITIPVSVKNIGQVVFYNCSSLTSITFEGTIEEWNVIPKDIDWNYNVPATYVQCSDGQVAL